LRTSKGKPRSVTVTITGNQENHSDTKWKGRLWNEQTENVKCSGNAPSRLGKKRMGKNLKRWWIGADKESG
jgi:hypothetical protein